MGAYHTIDLELNRKFTLIKEYWDIIALERVGKFHWKFDLFIFVMCTLFIDKAFTLQIIELRPLKHIDWAYKLASEKVNMACVTKCRGAERCQSLKSHMYINVKTIVSDLRTPRSIYHMTIDLIRKAILI